MRRPERCDEGQASLATPGARAGGREAQGDPPLASSHVTPCDTDVRMKRGGGGGGGDWEGPTQGCSSLPPLVAERGIRRSSVTEFLEMEGGGGGSQRRGRGTEIPERREERRSQRGGGGGGGDEIPERGRRSKRGGGGDPREEGEWRSQKRGGGDPREEGSGDPREWVGNGDPRGGGDPREEDGDGDPREEGGDGDPGEEGGARVLLLVGDKLEALIYDILPLTALP